MFASRKRLLIDRGPSWPDYDKAKAFHDQILFAYFVKDQVGFLSIYLFIRY